MFKQYIFLLFLFITTQTYAQNYSVPVPAKSQSKSVALIGATAHLGNGEVIENSVVEFADGKLVLVGSQDKVKPNADSERIEVHGKHIYPGLIAANTAIGLVEIGAVRATRDYTETGSLNPNVRSIISYNTDSRVTPTLRSNGVLLAQVAPQGGTISGQSSVVTLDAWNWEDAAYKMDEGLFVNWPRKYIFKGWWAEPGGIEPNKKYGEISTKMSDLFAEAKAYCEGTPKETNLKLAAMCGLFDKSKKLYVRVNLVREIIDAVNFAKKFGVDMVVVGGEESWMATDILKENNVPVIINRVHELPSRADEDIDIAFRLPKILQDAGILYAITVGSGWDGFWDQRNLAFHAGTASTYGLTKEQALMAITANPAKILGIDERIGSLEKGKDATLIVSSGDLLDIRTNNVEHAFIQGRKIDLDNKQKALYRKFMKKYNKEPKL